MKIFLGFCIFLLGVSSYVSWQMGSSTPSSRLSNIFSRLDRVGRWILISGFGLFAGGYALASLSIFTDWCFKIAAAGYILLIVAAVPVLVGFIWRLISHPSLHKLLEDVRRVRSLDWYTSAKQLPKAVHFLAACVASILTLLVRGIFRKQNEFKLESSVERSEKERCESLGHYYLPENEYYLLLSDDDD